MHCLVPRSASCYLCSFLPPMGVTLDIPRLNKDIPRWNKDIPRWNKDIPRWNKDIPRWKQNLESLDFTSFAALLKIPIDYQQIIIDN